MMSYGRNVPGGLAATNQIPSHRKFKTGQLQRATATWSSGKNHQNKGISVPTFTLNFNRIFDTIIHASVKSITFFSLRNMDCNTSELEEPDFSSDVGSPASVLKAGNIISPSCRTSDLEEDDAISSFSLLSSNPSSKDKLLRSECSDFLLADGLCDSPIGHSTEVGSFLEELGCSEFTATDCDSSMDCYPISNSSDESQDENGKSLFSFYNNCQVNTFKINTLIPVNNNF